MSNVAVECQAVVRAAQADRRLAVECRLTERNRHAVERYTDRRVDVEDGEQRRGAARRVDEGDLAAVERRARSRGADVRDICAGGCPSSAGARNGGNVAFDCDVAVRDTAVNGFNRAERADNHVARREVRNGEFLDARSDADCVVAVAESERGIGTAREVDEVIARANVNSDVRAAVGDGIGNAHAREAVVLVVALCQAERVGFAAADNSDAACAEVICRQGDNAFESTRQACRNAVEDNRAYARNRRIEDDFGRGAERVVSTERAEHVACLRAVLRPAADVCRTRRHVAAQGQAVGCRRRGEVGKRDVDAGESRTVNRDNGRAFRNRDAFDLVVFVGSSAGARQGELRHRFRRRSEGVSVVAAAPVRAHRRRIVSTCADSEAFRSSGHRAHCHAGECQAVAVAFQFDEACARKSRRVEGKRACAEGTDCRVAVRNDFSAADRVADARARVGCAETRDREE